MFSFWSSELINTNILHWSNSYLIEKYGSAQLIQLFQKFLVILSLAAMAMARPQEQPASFACPNYPFCAIAANAPAPQQYQPHQDLYLAQRQALNQPLVADVPGIAQWYADLHAVSILVQC